MSYNFAYLSQNNFFNSTSVLEYKTTNKVNIDLYRNCLDFPFLANDVLENLSLVNWRGRVYCIGYYILSHLEHDAIIYKIKHILLLKEDKVYIIAQKIKTNTFCKNYRAYETNNEEEMLFYGLYLSNTIIRPFHLHTLPCGKFMFKPNFV